MAARPPPKDWHRDVRGPGFYVGRVTYLWFFVCVDDTTLANDATWVMPGSHRPGARMPDWSPRTTTPPPPSSLQICAKAGDILVIIHDLRSAIHDGPVRVEPTSSIPLGLVAHLGDRRWHGRGAGVFRVGLALRRDAHRHERRGEDDIPTFHRRLERVVVARWRSRVVEREYCALVWRQSADEAALKAAYRSVVPVVRHLALRDHRLAGFVAGPSHHTTICDRMNQVEGVSLLGLCSSGSVDSPWNSRRPDW